MTGVQRPSEPLLDTAPCGFITFTDDGIVRLVNATCLEMLGLVHEAVVGRHVENLLTVGSKIFYQTHLFPLLRLHGHADEIFLLFRSANGEEVGALINAIRRERDGTWVTDCAVMRVRERRRFEDALVRAKQEVERQRVIADHANRAKSAFLAAMSHELRTPLNAIGGYVQLLEMGIHGPVTAAQTEALQRVARSQRHLLRLINEVLNLAKIEAGGTQYDIKRLTLRELVDAVLPMIEPQMTERGLSCEVRVSSELAVLADRDKAGQVLLNLLGNAVKFTPRGGRVRVVAVLVPDHPERVQLHVEDTGIGIAADRLEQVFEPFVQVELDSAHRSEGTGLGLAISRDLARGMGGELTAKSVLGVGSTFTLELPAA